MYLRTLAKLQKAASELGDCEIIVVTQYEEIAAKANTLGVKVLINPQPERGISSSMQIGLATAKDSSACLFTVSDQPWLTAETIINLVDKFRMSRKEWHAPFLAPKPEIHVSSHGILSGTDGNYRR